MEAAPEWIPQQVRHDENLEMISMTYDTLLVETRGAVTLVTLNRPQALNALNSGVLDDLIAAFAAFEADPGQRCAVLTGSGDGRRYQGNGRQARVRFLPRGFLLEMDERFREEDPQAVDRGSQRLRSRRGLRTRDDG